MNIKNKLPEVVFHRHVLGNGAVVIVVPKPDTPLVAVNMLYRTGSKDEDPDRTGLAHLMEHLMFSGTKSFPAFDLPVARTGGMNNAFTSKDITSYYTLLPAEYLPLVLEMEADRLINLRLDEKSVELQKNVVVEEFRQRYLNQPYGDMNHLLGEAAWKIHPYRWPTIGLVPEHIEKTTAEDVLEFYHNNYNPSNLIITIAGNVVPNQVMETVSRFFGTIPGVSISRRSITVEPSDSRQNKITVYRDVPSSYLLVSFPVTGSASADFTGFSFLADILGQGIISRLHKALVSDKRIFTRISAGLTGTTDPGLLTISGMLHKGEDPDRAASGIQRVIDDFQKKGPTSSEMKAVVNGTLTQLLFKRTGVLNLAMEAATAEYEGDISRINKVIKEIGGVTSESVSYLTRQYLIKSNRIEIHYLKK